MIVNKALPPKDEGFSPRPQIQETSSFHINPIKRIQIIPQLQIQNNPQIQSMIQIIVLPIGATHCPLPTTCFIFYKINLHKTEQTNSSRTTNIMTNYSVPLETPVIFTIRKREAEQ